MPKYIKTSERLPDKEGRYIVIKRVGKHKNIENFIPNYYPELWVNENEEWLDESEEEITIPTLDLITNVALQASIGKLPDNKRKMLITTTCMNEEQAKLFLQDMNKMLHDELERRNNEITDTQRLDWLENNRKGYCTTLKDDYIYETYLHHHSLREFIDKQIKHE